MSNGHFLCLHLPMWAKAGFRVMKEHHSALVCFFVSQIKQIDSRNHRIHQNVARKSVTNCAIASCVTDLLFFTTFWGHLWSNWTDAWHHWIYFVNITTCMTGIRFHFWYQLLDPFTLTIQTRHEVSAVLLPVDLPLTVTSAESEFHSGIDLA